MNQNGSKSSLHDATPSWNGFNYQGKVGLNTALTKILKLLTLKTYDKYSFEKEIEHIKLEYEWLEDFSIKNGDQYESLHQVKHYKETNFSKYKDAIDTILTRRSGTISKNDLLDYLSVHDISEPEKKSEQLLKDLIAYGLISPEHSLLVDWQKKIPLLEESLRPPTNSCLQEYQNLLINAYSDKVPNYVHTSLPISEPSQELDKYTWSSTASTPISPDKTLDNYNIFFRQSANTPYTLALNDIELNYSILENIKSIKTIIAPKETTLISEASYTCYMGALLESIDKHICERHENLRPRATIGKFNRPVTPFHLTTVLNILEKEIREHDTTYFATRAEYTINNIISKIEQALSEELETESTTSETGIQLAQKLQRLQNYKKNILENLTPTELLTKLQQASPHIKKTSPQDVYFNEILQHSEFKNVFLEFITSLSTTPKEFHPVCKKNLRYSPSCINLEHEIGLPDRAYKKIAQSITHACDTDTIIDALIYNYHFITIRTKPGESTNTPIELPKVGNDYSDDQASPHPNFGKKLHTRLISIADAVTTIDGAS